jgi:hypothetical protein
MLAREHPQLSCCKTYGDLLSGGDHQVQVEEQARHDHRLLMTRSRDTYRAWQLLFMLVAVRT